MKKLLNHVLIILIMLVILPIKLEASTFDVYSATSSTDTKDKSFGTYNEALTYMNNSSNRDLYIKRGSEILFAKYGIGYVNNPGNTIYMYDTPTLSGFVSYISGVVSDFGGDVAILDYNNNTNAIKIKIAGATGWVDKQYIRVKPIVKNVTPHYYIFDGNITHKLRNENGTARATLYLGKNTTTIKNNTMYSYDGKYFYTNLYTMLDDYKKNIVTNATNKQPYYNYYMYLPHHSKTLYSPTEIELYINSKNNNDRSLLKGESISYSLGQELYGTNAALSLSLSMNESNNGKSGIAQFKSNVFGHGAVDNNPSGGAQENTNIRQSIFSHAYGWVTYSYGSVDGTYYKGSNLGNKISGMNVHYASDPYWSEKAISNYVGLESYYSSTPRDYDFYTIALKKDNSTVYARKSPADSSIIKSGQGNNYVYNRKDVPVLILGEATHNGVKYYKVISDHNFGPNHVAKPRQDLNIGRFDWDHSYVYVEASKFTQINNIGKTPKNLDDTYMFEDLEYNYIDYIYNGSTLKAAKMLKSLKGYTSPTLNIEISNATKLGVNHQVVVYQEARDSNGIIIAYQIGTSLRKTEKVWVSPTDIQFIDAKIIRLTFKGSYIGAYLNTTPTNAERPEPYFTGTLATISNDTTKVGNETYHKIKFDMTTTFVDRYILEEDSDQKLIITNYKASANTAPVISASNKTIVKGNTFTPLAGVTAIDKEDGNITSQITVTSNNVNTSVVGTYNVTYSVTDNHGLTATKTITVTVIDKPVVKSANYFKHFKVENNKLMLSGYNATTGHEMSDSTKITHTLRFTSLEEDNVHYDINIPVLTDKSKMDRPIFINDKKDYTYAWYEGEINYNNIPQGNYILEVISESNLALTKTVLSNNLYNSQINTYTNNEGKTITSISNYGKDYGPIEVYIRESIHLEKNTNSMYNKYNTLREMEFVNNKLRLYGAAYSFNVDYSDNIDVTQKLILENINTKEITSFDLLRGNELFKLQPPTKDNLSKKNSWFDSDIDLSNLNHGIYDIYVHTTTIKKDSSGNVILTSKDFTTLRNGLYLTLPTINVNGKTIKILDDYISIKLEVS